MAGRDAYKLSISTLCRGSSRRDSIISTSSASFIISSARASTFARCSGVSSASFCSQILYFAYPLLIVTVLSRTIRFDFRVDAPDFSALQHQLALSLLSLFLRDCACLSIGIRPTPPMHLAFSLLVSGLKIFLWRRNPAFFLTKQPNSN